MKKAVDWSRPVQTREGHPLRVLCTDMIDAKWPVVALRLEGDQERIEHYQYDGSYLAYSESQFDAINAPVKKHGWVNIYAPDSSRDGTWVANRIHGSEAEADRTKSDGRVACVKIEWVEE